MPAAKRSRRSCCKRFDVVDFPTDQLKLIVFGRVVDTTRAKEAFGFAPKFTTVDALVDFRDNRTARPDAGPGPRPSWERELFEYLKQKTKAEKETV